MPGDHYSKGRLEPSCDVHIADSMEAIKIKRSSVKAPILNLVLQHAAIVGAKSSPEVLLQLMKAMTTYFDQTPGTYRF